MKKSIDAKDYPKDREAKSTLGGSFSRSEKSGVETGLSSIHQCDISEHGPDVVEDWQRPQVDSSTASEKGKKFEIC